MRMHGRMRMRIYWQTYMRKDHYTNSKKWTKWNFPFIFLIKKRTANLNDAIFRNPQATSCVMSYYT